MKHLLILAFITLFTCKASAQQSVAEALNGRMNPEEPHITANEALSLIGKYVYVCDTVYDYKAVNPSLGLLQMGSKDSAKALTVVLKNKNPTSRPEVIIGGQMCLSGKVVRYKGRPAIFVPDFGNRISL